MKRVYRTPVAKYLNYEYDTQVVATSPGMCNTELKITKIVEVNAVDPCSETIKDTFIIQKSIFPPACFSFTN